MSVELVVGFDGSCPHHEDGVRREAEDRWTVFPGWRAGEGISEEAVGCGSRLSLRLHNNSSVREEVVIRADWQTERRTRHHDMGYIRHEDDADWSMVPALRQAAVAEYHLCLRPGTTQLGLYPEYNYADLLQMLDDLKSAGVDVGSIGRSREGREIPLIVWLSDSEAAVDLFIHARDHAYETASSYCVEGICDFLRSGQPLAEYILSKFNIHILPMSNPDGVFNGMSRLTWEQGADMNRVQTRSDQAHDAFRQYLLKLAPKVLMNLHNWEDRFVDGLLMLNSDVAGRIMDYMPADSRHFKRWHYSGKIRPEADWCWRFYCDRHFDGIGVCFEFPWFSLNTESMKGKGVRALQALCLAVVEEMDL